jgi:RES domain
VRHVTRGSEYLRVADPSWRNPLSGAYSRRQGGRWNPAGAFNVVYLNATLEVARAQVRHKLETRGIRPEDLHPEQGPLLVRTTLPRDRYVDAVSDRGLRSLGLPSTYPHDARGRTISPGACQPIGQRAHDQGERGIACRSAARTAPPDGEELAYFAPRRLRRRTVERFAEWY